MQSRILKLPHVIERTALSRSSIYAYISQKRFTAPVPLGEKAVGWLESEITAWILEKSEIRRARNHTDHTVSATGGNHAA